MNGAADNDEDGTTDALVDEDEVDDAADIDADDVARGADSSALSERDGEAPVEGAAVGGWALSVLTSHCSSSTFNLRITSFIRLLFSCTLVSSSHTSAANSSGSGSANLRHVPYSLTPLPPVQAK